MTIRGSKIEDIRDNHSKAGIIFGGGVVRNVYCVCLRCWCFCSLIINCSQSVSVTYSQVSLVWWMAYVSHPLPFQPLRIQHSLMHQHFNRCSCFDSSPAVHHPFLRWRCDTGGITWLWWTTQHCKPLITLAINLQLIRAAAVVLGFWGGCRECYTQHEI